jgi:predicted flap endonuclease-1-like 5' DNA nuclease
MSGFACCFWWFVFGVLVGWLLSWLLSKFLSGNSGSGSGDHYIGERTVQSLASVPAPAPVAAPAPAPVAVPAVDPRLAFITAAATAGVIVKGEDDLQVIEGIGPKICGLLNAAGIYTFKQLADSPVEKVQAILDAAGPRFKLANPASWAQQSRLCATGDWAGFKKLTDELVAGVAKAKPAGEDDH